MHSLWLLRLPALVCLAHLPRMPFPALTPSFRPGHITSSLKSHPDPSPQEVTPSSLEHMLVLVWVSTGYNYLLIDLSASFRQIWGPPSYLHCSSTTKYAAWQTQGAQWAPVLCPVSSMILTLSFFKWYKCGTRTFSWQVQPQSQWALSIVICRNVFFLHWTENCFILIIYLFNYYFNLF